MAQAELDHLHLLSSRQEFSSVISLQVSLIQLAPFQKQVVSDPQVGESALCEQASLEHFESVNDHLHFKSAAQGFLVVKKEQTSKAHFEEFGVQKQLVPASHLSLVSFERQASVLQVDAAASHKQSVAAPQLDVSV